MNGRWWEYYTVRYLVGSIVGAVAILYLGKYSGSQCSEDVKPLLEPLFGHLGKYSGSQCSEDVKPLLEPLFGQSNYLLSAIALAALGFAFCYIASSPILVFHACRAYFHPPKLWERFKEFRKVRRTIVAIAIIVATGSIIFICINYLPLLTRILILPVFILQIALLIFACIDRFETIKTFYEDLAEKRAKPTKLKPNKIDGFEIVKTFRKDHAKKRAKPTKSKPKKKSQASKSLKTEYTTSYRHLREHGNAMGIIVLEVILAFALANLPSINFAVVVLVFWILPGVFAWIIGTALEFNFVDRFPFR